jgi:Bacterial protein of unknown function (DUF945)
MQRSVQIGLAALASVAMGVPLWSGCEAHDAFADAMLELQRAAGPAARVDFAYHQGWLRSEAESHLALAGGLAITLHHVVTPGPLALGELLDGRWPGPPVRAIVDTWLGPDAIDPDAPGPPYARARTRIGLDGTVRVELESPAHRSGDGALVWGGLRGSAALAGGAGSHAALEVPSLVVVAGAARFELAGLTAELDASDVGSLPLGEVSLRIERLELRRPDGAVALRDLRASQRSEDDPVADAIQMTTTASLGSLELDGERWGPGACALVLRNLDRDVLAELDRPGDAAEAEARARELLGRLLARRPELELGRCELPGPGGTLAARAHLVVSGGHPGLPPGRALAAAAIEAELDAHAPGPLLRRLVAGTVAPRGGRVAAADAGPDPLRSLVLGGVLVPEPGGYGLRLELHGGEAFVNGRRLDAAALSAAGLLGP